MVQKYVSEGECIEEEEQGEEKKLYVKLTLRI